MKSYIEEAADFISKDCKRVKASKLKEDKYLDIDSELNDVINGGWDAFEPDEDLMNPDKAKAIHRDAQAAGLSDLDYVNKEEALESIEDDWARDLEIQDYYSGFADIINDPTLTDIYSQDAEELANTGSVAGGYGHRITDAGELLDDILDGALQYIGDELPCPPAGWRLEGYEKLQFWLDEASKYANNPVTPKCKAFYECLVTLAQEYNTILKDVLGSPKWPVPVVIPAVGGVVNESTQLQEDIWGDDFDDEFPAKKMCSPRKKAVKEEVFNKDQIMLADEFLSAFDSYFDVQDKKKSGYSGVVGRIVVVADPSLKDQVRKDAEEFAASKGLEVYNCSDFINPGKFDIEFAKTGSAKSISDFYKDGCKFESVKSKKARKVNESALKDVLSDIQSALSEEGFETGSTLDTEDYELAAQIVQDILADAGLNPNDANTVLEDQLDITC